MKNDYRGERANKDGAYRVNTQGINSVNSQIRFTGKNFLVEFKGKVP